MTFQTQPNGGFRQALIVARYETLNYLGSRRLFILFGVEVAAAIGFTLLASLHHASTPLAFYSNWLGSEGGVSLELYLVALGVILFGGDAICGEYQNRTVYFTMTNPVGRPSVYIGKYFASFGASILAMSVFILTGVGNALYYYGLSAFPLGLGESVALSFLYLASSLGLVYLLSSVFKSSSTAMITAAFLFLFGFVLIQDLASFFMEPWFLLSYGADVVSNTLVVPYPTHLLSGASNMITGGSTLQYNPTVLEGFEIMLGYLILTFILGLFVFQRREFS